MNVDGNRIVEALLLGTKNGTFRWESTPQEELYRCMLETGIVRASPSEITLIDTSSMGNVLETNGVMRLTDLPAIADLYREVQHAMTTEIDFTVRALCSEIIEKSHKEGK